MKVILDNEWEYLFEENYTRFGIWVKHDWWHLKRWDNAGGWQTITSVPLNNKVEALQFLTKIAKDFA